MVYTIEDSLLPDLKAAFEAERAAGEPAGYRGQSPDSFARLDAAVRSAILDAFKQGGAEAFSVSGLKGQGGGDGFRSGLPNRLTPPVATAPRVGTTPNTYMRPPPPLPQRYMHFNEDHYVRNLVYSCDDFELLVRGVDERQGCRRSAVPCPHRRPPTHSAPARPPGRCCVGARDRAAASTTMATATVGGKTSMGEDSQGSLGTRRSGARPTAPRRTLPDAP